MGGDKILNVTQNIIEINEPHWTERKRKQARKNWSIWKKKTKCENEESKKQKEKKLISFH